MPPTRWLEIRIRPGEQDPALAVEALLEAGGRAVGEDGPWLVTHLPEPEDGPAGVDVLVQGLLGALGDPDLPVEVRWQDQEDWAEFWKRGLEVRRLTPRLVVSPSWLDPEAGPGDLVLVLDPGMAFGNAEHGTTRGCLRILDEVVRSGDRILDVGAGSGVLGIAAARMGALQVLGVESDSMAVPTARENVALNGVADRVRIEERLVTARDLLPGGSLAGPWDGVVANLEAGLLRPLLDGLAAAVRPGGWLLVSGILDHEWPGLRQALEGRGLEFRTLDADGEWRSGLLVRQG